ncbi:hypothetical protein ACB376_12815 [Klebsiella electrica]
MTGLVGRACGTGAVCSPVALRLPGLRGCGVWLYRLAYRPRGARGTGTVCSPVALRLPGLRVGAVSGFIAWRIACGRACGTGVVCSPVALCLPGLRVGAVLGISTWRIACGGVVARVRH